MFAMFVSPSHDSTRLNLFRLFILRAIGIAGQLLVITVTVRWLEVSLPLWQLGVIIGFLLVWNLLTWQRLQQVRTITDGDFLFQLTIDIVALAGMLYFTGGATNPFTWIFLLPVIIAATVLPRRFAWALAGLTIACYSLLIWFFVPLHPADMSSMGHDMSHGEIGRASCRERV